MSNPKTPEQWEDWIQFEANGDRYLEYTLRETVATLSPLPISQVENALRVSRHQNKDGNPSTTLEAMLKVATEILK